MNNWYVTDVMVADHRTRHASAAEQRRLVRPRGRIHRALASVTALPSDGRVRHVAERRAA